MIILVVLVLGLSITETLEVSGSVFVAVLSSRDPKGGPPHFILLLLLDYGRDPKGPFGLEWLDVSKTVTPLGPVEWVVFFLDLVVVGILAEHPLGAVLVR